MAMKVCYPPLKPSDIRVTLDVGGQQFKTLTNTLVTLPTTRLGKLALEAERHRAKSLELFFDRNPDIMNCLLDFYRTGKLHIPKHMCVEAAARELQFWEVPVQLLEDCCWCRYDIHENAKVVVAQIDHFLKDLYSDFTSQKVLSWRMRIWMTLERPAYSTASKIWSMIYLLFIFLAVLTFTLENVFSSRRIRSSFLETYPEYQNFTLEELELMLNLAPMETAAISIPNDSLRFLRYITFAFFLSDFFVRLVVCPAKKRFFQQPRNWLETFIIIQSFAFFYLENKVIPYKIRTKNTTDFDRLTTAVVMSLTSIRALRIFYLAKNFDNMKILVLCMKSSAKEMLMLVICVVCFVTLFGTLTYTAEVLVRLKTFPNILSAMWWAIITMTTVGYGDLYPISPFGRVVGSVCALCGLIVVALPIAVITSRFAVYHENLRPRQQRISRTAFQKDNPEFDQTDVMDAEHEALKRWRRGSGWTMEGQEDAHENRDFDDVVQAEGDVDPTSRGRRKVQVESPIDVLLSQVERDTDDTTQGQSKI